MTEYDNLARFKILTTGDVKDAQLIREAFRKKHILEKQIAQMIKNYENETGLAIDSIHYQRDITLPIKGPKYTSLAILISAEEYTERNTDG